jgi:glycosyltransferase involved in cell wall biosynthesis
MRILVVTNLYPPHCQGGYEVRCAQVSEALVRAGHDVCVVTSTHGLPIDWLGNAKPHSEQLNGVPVHRWLGQYMFPPQPLVQHPWTLQTARRELRDARRFVALVEQFRPDVVNWWSMYGLSKALLPLPGARGIPDVHWIEHWWMIAEYGPAGEIAAAFWRSVWDGAWGPPSARPLFRRIGRAWERRVAREGFATRDFPNRPSHVCFVSEYLLALHRDAGISFASSEILHGGVPVEAFYAPLAQRGPRGSALRLLFAGQMTEDRGLHTIVEALGQLDPDARSRVTLDVAGGGAANTYQDRVRELVSQLGLGESVTFLGRVPHGEMARLYADHDVLVFPSMREEGLPLTMVEAMLSGCAVITTGSGGAEDIALAADLPLFPKGDAEALAQLLGSLIADPAAVAQLAARCQQVALAEFGLEQMMKRWIETLERLVARAHAA